MGWAPTGEVLDVRRSQIAVQVIDEFTGKPPLSRPVVTLQALEGADWVDTGIVPALTSTGVYTWPRLERRVTTGLPARDYRVLVEAEFYRPLYPSATDPGVPFSVTPHNVLNPVPTASSAVPLYLLPASNYPFEMHLRVLRGRVLDDTTLEPVADAIVSQGTTERVLSDELGGFSLPLRWPARVVVGLQIDADDRGPRSGAIQVDLPGDLGKNHDIPIS